jgi:hypothetical protein
MTSSESVHRMIDDLPPELQQEAIHFIEELARRGKKPSGKKVTLSWAGGLARFAKGMTSVELQHKAREWRD